MQDTISAAISWDPTDIGPTFLIPDDSETQDPSRIDRVSGGSQSTETYPSPIVEFTTITPDFKGLLSVSLPPPEHANMVGDPVTVPAGVSSVIVAFDVHHVTIIKDAGT